VAIVAISNSKALSAVILKNIDSKLASRMDKAGQTVVDKARELLKANVGGYTKLVESVGYEIDKNNIIVFCTSDIGKYLEKGTKPHIIRAKPGKSLAFTSNTGGTRKNGSKYEIGDTIMTQEVHHPGFDSRPWFHLASFMTKNTVKEILEGRR